MRVERWQTKHITDAMVVGAVARYCADSKEARKGARGLFDPFGANAEWPKFPYETLAALTGAPEKVTYAACERACDRNLIEFGVSLRTGWLTTKGEELLAVEIA
ncbi:MAG TPA: hypothetical protein VIU82_25130 [Bosea sp. (in: a-proteobacteria)]